MIEDFANESVIYLEIRTTPREILGQMTKRSYVETVLDAINTSPLKTITVKLLLSINRSETSEQALETAKLAVEFKDKGVVGIDLSGNPTVGDYSTFVSALELAKSNGLKRSIHVAEVNNPQETRVN